MAIVFDGPRGSLVAACSRTAVAQGVHPNMPLAEAQALAPHLAVAPHNSSADRRALEKLAEACEQFTPFVALEDPGEPASAGGATGHPETLLLDITNLEHLHGSEHQLATRIKTLFTRRGYHTRIAIAPTLAQAWALAHFNGEPASAGGNIGIDCKLKIDEESVRASTNSQFAIPLLPIESLRISPETATLLHDLGIQTIAQLQLLPRDDLAQRFGDELLRRLDQFTGAAPEAIQPHRAVAELEVSCDLEEPTADRAVLMHALNQLIHQLTRRLIARDQGAVLLWCTLSTPHYGEVASATAMHDFGLRILDCGLKNPNPKSEIRNPKSIHLRIALVEPTANPQQLLELIDLHLETLSLADEVDRVQIRAAAVGRLGERQGELFTDRWPSNPHQLALLINRLSSRLGHDQVLRAEPRNSPVPERAVRWAPMTTQRTNKKLQIANWQGIKNKPSPKMNDLQFAICNLQSPRPLLLHPHPQPIKVVSVAPDGPPQCIWLENRRQPIVHHVGPERIETLWWRGPTIRRDYYHIITASGSHLWIFRRLSDAAWFLHGEFA